MCGNSQCGGKKLLSCSNKSEILIDAKITFVCSTLVYINFKMVELKGNQIYSTHVVFDESDLYEINEKS